MAEIYDLIVIGTGSVGSSTGYYAAKRGLSVLEIDSATPPHTNGSHHGETRMIRHAYGEGSSYVPLVLRAQELWNELKRDTQVDIFHQTGVLNIAPKQSSFLNNIITSAEKYELPIEVYDAFQARKKWPQFTIPDQFKAVLEKNSGYLKSELAIDTYVKEAKRLGAHEQFNTQVISVDNDENGSVHVTTNEGIFIGKSAVITVGTWVKDLIPNLPIQPVRKVVSWFEAPKPLAEETGFPSFTIQLGDGTHYYGFPANKGLIKIGRHQGGQYITKREERLDFNALKEDKTETSPLLNSVLKTVGNLDHGVACSYDLSPDEHFIIDDLPGKKNIQFVSGLSGHGFKFASVLGEILVAKALNETLDFDLSPFLLSRFNS